MELKKRIAYTREDGSSTMLAAYRTEIDLSKIDVPKTDG
jgi:hypothetical protein